LSRARAADRGADLSSTVVLVRGVRGVPRPGGASLRRPS
jgi:hypothetical protein